MPNNKERNDIAKELLHTGSAEAYSLMNAESVLSLHIEQRYAHKFIVCEVVGSNPLEFVVIIPLEDNSYTLQALRPLQRGEQLLLRRKGGSQLVEGWLYNCRKGIRDKDPPMLHLAGFKITQGAF